MLIEVLIASVLLALIVVGTLTGLDSNNRVTSLDRARAQADALAQQDEDQLRSESIGKISELNRTRTVTENGTTYTITTTAQYQSNATATSSCTSTSPSADYVRTTSTVTWPSIGASTPVAETSLISPPPGTALIVQVLAGAEPVPSAIVSVTGPTPATTETSTNGCAILALLPGSYAINVHKTGYVDQNDYENTSEDLADIQSRYLVAETSTKAGYLLAPASQLVVKFSGASPAEGDTFVAFNSGQTALKQFGTLGSFATTVASPTKIYPFGASKYTVYAGTCEADLPTRNGIASNPEVEVVPGKIVPVTVPLAPVNIKVMSGYAAGVGKEGSALANLSGTITDAKCTAPTKRSVTTNPIGGLTKPGVPFGEYNLCVGAGGTTGKRFEGTFTNNSATGPNTAWTNGGGTSPGVIYLGTSPSGTPAGNVKAGGECP